jgi:hypothetical protein
MIKPSIPQSEEQVDSPQRPLEGRRKPKADNESHIKTSTNHFRLQMRRKNDFRLILDNLSLVSVSQSLHEARNDEILPEEFGRETRPGGSFQAEGRLNHQLRLVSEQLRESLLTLRTFWARTSEGQSFRFRALGLGMPRGKFGRKMAEKKAN